MSEPSKPPSARGSRSIAIVALVAGSALFVGELIAGALVFTAAWHGAAVAVGAMVLLGMALRFWRGDEIQSASGPGGTGVEFSQATEGALEKLNDRLDAQMEDVNRRLYDLETRIFKAPAPGPDTVE